MQNNNQPHEPALLITVNTDMEADRIIAALSDAGIPAYREYGKETSTSAVLTGNAIGSVQIFVPAEAEEQAIDILIGIGAVQAPGEEDDGEALEDEDELSEHPVKRWKVWITVIAVLLAITAAVFLTDGVMRLIRAII